MKTTDYLTNYRPIFNREIECGAGDISQSGNLFSDNHCPAETKVNPSGCCGKSIRQSGKGEEMENNKVNVSSNQSGISRMTDNEASEYSSAIEELLRIREIVAKNNIESDVTDLAMTLVAMTNRGQIDWTLKDNKYTTRVQFEQLKDPLDCELFVNADDEYPSIILRVSQEESQNQMSWCYYYGHGDGSGELLACVAGKVLGLTWREMRQRYVELHPQYAARA